MHKVIVYPTHKNAKNIVHPRGGPLKETGSEWPNDGFTARMLTDNEATLDKAKGYTSAPEAAPAPVAPVAAQVAAAPSPDPAPAPAKLAIDPPKATPVPPVVTTNT